MNNRKIFIGEETESEYISITEMISDFHKIRDQVANWEAIFVCKGLTFNLFLTQSEELYNVVNTNLLVEETYHSMDKLIDDLNYLKRELRHIAKLEHRIYANGGHPFFILRAIHQKNNELVEENNFMQWFCNGMGFTCGAFPLSIFLLSIV